MVHLVPGSDEREIHGNVVAVADGYVEFGREAVFDSGENFLKLLFLLVVKCWGVHVWGYKLIKDSFGW